MDGRLIVAVPWGKSPGAGGKGFGDHRKVVVALRKHVFALVNPAVRARLVLGGGLKVVAEPRKDASALGFLSAGSRKA
jgi:hypothetical protein